MFLLIPFGYQQIDRGFDIAIYGALFFKDKESNS